MMFLSSSTMGIGFLFLPSLCGTIGLGNMSILMVIACLGNAFGSYLVVNAWVHFKTENYPDLVYITLGRKHYILLTTLLVMFITFYISVHLHYGWIISH